jgi:hypothetical protein
MTRVGFELKVPGFERVKLIRFPVSEGNNLFYYLLINNSFDSSHIYSLHCDMWVCSLMYYRIAVHSSGTFLYHSVFATKLFDHLHIN